jgi:hypothetical protein
MTKKQFANWAKERGWYGVNDAIIDNNFKYLEELSKQDYTGVEHFDELKQKTINYLRANKLKMIEVKNG